MSPHPRLLPALVLPIAAALLAVAGWPAAADTVPGTRDDDVLVGSPGGDRLVGRAGDDELRGRAGRDELYGGAGSDLLRGGPDGDYLEGGAGPDRLSGGAGRDFLADYRGGDLLRGGPGRDRSSIDSRGASDPGPTVLRLGRGDDEVMVADDGGRDVIDCGAGHDVVEFLETQDEADELVGCEVVRRYEGM